jgi:hypothetical protein
VTEFALTGVETLTLRRYGRCVEPIAPPDVLRKAVLMAAVLDDIDVVPADDGVVMTGAHDLFLAWSDLSWGVAGCDPCSAEGRRILVRWLTTARRWADLPVELAMSHLRPVALPRGHALHPGDSWVRRTVPGDVLDVGLGLVGLDPARPDELQIAPRGLLELTGVDLDASWHGADDYLERMGAMAAHRLRRDPEAPLRPMGDCDALTLLGSFAFRRALAEADGVGMRGVAVPMRRRGWTDPDHVASAFARAAASATDDEARGLSDAVLVTVDGVYTSIGGLLPSDFTLREAKDRRPAQQDRTFDRPVRYRSM